MQGRTAAALVLLFAMAPPVSANAERSALTEGDVRMLLRKRFADLHIGGEETQVTIAFADLDDDGRREALAYISGQGRCGTGGCNLYVVRKGARGAEIIGRKPAVNLPIRVLEHRTRGWRDIGLVARQDAMTRYEVALRFDGWKYASLPKVETKVRYLPDRSGRVVIPIGADASPL